MSLIKPTNIVIPHAIEINHFTDKNEWKHGLTVFCAGLAGLTTPVAIDTGPVLLL